MYCKFCGTKNEDDAVLCCQCGAQIGKEEQKDISVEQAAMSEEQEGMLAAQPTVSDEKNAETATEPSKLTKVIQKCLLGSYIAGLTGLVIFLGVVVAGLIAHGKIYLFNGYTYTKVLSIISIVLMLTGVCGVIAKCILSLVFKIGEFPAKVIKKVMLISLAVVCLGCSVWGFVDCGNNSNDSNLSSGLDSSSDSDNTGSTKVNITQTQAIYLAKNSYSVKYKIAGLYDLKSFYINWGTVTAKYEYGCWRIEMRGAVSGLSGDYADDYVIDKKFNVIVQMNGDGSFLRVISAYKGY